jgi:hypothetical protein
VGEGDGPPLCRDVALARAVPPRPGRRLATVRQSERRRRTVSRSALCKRVPAICHPRAETPSCSSAANNCWTWTGANFASLLRPRFGFIRRRTICSYRRCVFGWTRDFAEVSQVVSHAATVMLTVSVSRPAARVGSEQHGSPPARMGPTASLSNCPTSSPSTGTVLAWCGRPARGRHFLADEPRQRGGLYLCTSLWSKSFAPHLRSEYTSSIPSCAGGPLSDSEDTVGEIPPRLTADLQCAY